MRLRPGRDGQATVAQNAPGVMLVSLMSITDAEIAWPAMWPSYLAPKSQQPIPVNCLSDGGGPMPLQFDL